MSAPELSDINLPEIVAELEAAGQRYEKALVTNDYPVLDELFWQSPDVVRFGVGENLYGAEQLKAFRLARSPLNLAREVKHWKVVTYGKNSGAITLEFVRVMNGIPREGRQSQMWHKFPDGWKVVSAHVSLLPLEVPK